MAIQCCKCKRVRVGHDWVEPTASSIAGHVSHGFCPVCYEETLMELNADMHMIHRSEGSRHHWNPIPQPVTLGA